MENQFDPKRALAWQNQLVAVSRKALDIARSAGADDCQCWCSRADTIAVTMRHQETEAIERADQVQTVITIFKDGRHASIAGNQLAPAILEQQISDALAMAAVALPDPDYNLTPADELASDPNPNSLDQLDQQSSSLPELMAVAKQLERSALDVKDVRQSEGASVSCTHAASALVTSRGLVNAKASSSHGLSVTVIAERDDVMEVDGDGIARCHRQDLPDPEPFGRAVGERAVAALGGKKLRSGTYTVVLDHDMSRALLRTLLQALNGQAIVRETSFLKDALQSPVFPSLINIVEDPLVSRSHRSRVVDFEGLRCQKAPLVNAGVLQRFLHTRETAAKLKHQPMGNAGAGHGRPLPSVANVIVSGGQKSFPALLRDIDCGLYVTSQMGMGINLVTGDYSQGVSGFAIRDGALAEPVREITIAGRLQEMFAQLDTDDQIIEKHGLSVPRFRLGEMTIAGTA